MRNFFLALICWILQSTSEAADVASAAVKNGIIAANVIEKKADLTNVNQVWRGADYVEFLQALSEGKLSLPRLDSPQNAAIFQRVVNLENLAFHQNHSNPIKTRFEDFYMLYRSANALLGQYFTQSGKPDMNLASEMAHLVAFNIHAAAVGSELADEFMAGIAQDEKYAARKEGMQQVASGLAMLFIAAEVVLTEKNGMSDADRSMVLSAMSTCLPRVKKNMAPDLRQELRKKLQDDVAKFPAAPDQAKLTTMLQELAK